MSNSSLALCTSGVVDSKFDVIPAVLVPVLGLLLVVSPWLRVRGKRLILLAPKEEKFAQNRKEEMAMLSSEMRTAAVLVAISALYETTVTALEMTGVNAGFDSGTLLTMLIVAIMSQLFGAGNGGTSSVSSRFFDASQNATDLGNNFLTHAVEVYSVIRRVSAILQLLIAVLLIAGVFVAYRTRRVMLGHFLGFLAWFLSVLISVILLIVPYAQLVPFPTCEPEMTTCTPQDLQYIFLVEKQVAGVLFGFVALSLALPSIFFVVPVWVRVAKLLVSGPSRAFGKVLYYSTFVLFFSLVSIAGISQLTQAVGLYSITLSIPLLWIISSVHLTPLSSYKCWFHFVGIYYLSTLFAIIWFALVSPLGCVIITFFSTNSGVEWTTVLARVIGVFMALLSAVAHIFLTNCGVWFLFNLSIKKAEAGSLLLKDASSGTDFDTIAP